MSLIKFEFKNEHLLLLKNLKWSYHLNKFLVSADDFLTDQSPFGGDDIYEDIDLILNGKPENFDPLSSNRKEFSLEQKEEWDKLMNELPIALDIVLYTNSFEIGHYKTRYHDRNWKKYDSNL